MRNAPGSVTGAILGTACLIGGIGLRIFAPEFRGFFNRGQSGDPIPIWSLLLVFAILNFAYALISHIIAGRADSSADQAPPPEAPGGAPKA